MSKAWLALVGLVLLAAGNVCALNPENKTRVFKMGLITTWDLNSDFSGYSSASAVSIAIEKVHADPKLNANGRIKLRYVGL